MISVVTHIIGENGYCSKCGLMIPQVTKENVIVRVEAGDRIGVVSGLKFTKDSSYLIQNPKHDSNKPCGAFVNV